MRAYFVLNKYAQLHLHITVVIIIIINSNKMGGTLTNCTHNTGLNNFHFKVILGRRERFSCNIQADTAVFLSTVAVYNNYMP